MYNVQVYYSIDEVWIKKNQMQCSHVRTHHTQKERETVSLVEESFKVSNE